MELCFLIEDRESDALLARVIGRLRTWGHRVDTVRPGGSLLDLSALVRVGAYDGWVLKSASNGPGSTVLEAAAATGLTTVNDARAIRAVRDKVVASIVGESVGLPMPRSYFTLLPGLLAQVPDDMYPLVVKPADGGPGRAVHLISDPDRLDALVGRLDGGRPWLAQRYVPGNGRDLRVYGIRGELWSSIRCSPLHPDRRVAETLVPVSRSIARLAHDVGSAFGLDLFGMDVVEGPDGPMVVDVDEFPGFGCVPQAASRIARAVVDVSSSKSSYRPSRALGEPGESAGPAREVVDVVSLVRANGRRPIAPHAAQRPGPGATDQPSSHLGSRGTTGRIAESDASPLSRLTDGGTAGSDADDVSTTL